MFIAEVSSPAFGLGMEIAYADIFEIPIIFIYKNGTELSGSLKLVSDVFIEYENKDDLIEKINSVIER